MVCHYPSAYRELLLILFRTPDTFKLKHTVRACTVRTRCTSAEVAPPALALTHPSSPISVSRDTSLHLPEAMSKALRLVLVRLSNGLYTGKFSWECRIGVRYLMERQVQLCGTVLDLRFFLWSFHFSCHEARYIHHGLLPG